MAAKKFLLVPSDTLIRENEKAMNDLDQEMNQILKQDLDDREKWILYQQTLQRFNHHATLARQPVPIEFTDNSVSLDRIPLKYRVKAQKILSSLSENSAVEWDNIGQVSIHGKSFKGSSIVDLIGEFVKPTKSKSPLPGYDSFVRVIAEATPLYQTPVRRRVIRKWTPYKRK